MVHGYVLPDIVHYNTSLNMKLLAYIRMYFFLLNLIFKRLFIIFVYLYLGKIRVDAQSLRFPNSVIMSTDFYSFEHNQQTKSPILVVNVIKGFFKPTLALYFSSYFIDISFSSPAKVNQTHLHRLCQFQ